MPKIGTSELTSATIFAVFTFAADGDKIVQRDANMVARAQVEDGRQEATKRVVRRGIAIVVVVVVVAAAAAAWLHA